MCYFGFVEWEIAMAETWNIYRKDVEGKLVMKIEANTRREALDARCQTNVRR
jgi:nitrate reductase NapAB chaperone NapD